MYVYIIKSLSRNWNYVGITKDIDNRFLRHNSGKEPTTKPYKPFDLIFVQESENYKTARKLEIFLKSRFNKEALLELF